MVKRHGLSLAAAELGGQPHVGGALVGLEDTWVGGVVGRVGVSGVLDDVDAVGGTTAGEGDVAPFAVGRVVGEDEGGLAGQPLRLVGGDARSRGRPSPRRGSRRAAGRARGCRRGRR